MTPVQPIRIRDLALLVVVAGVLSYLLVDTYYGDVPALPWTPSAALIGLALLEAVTGRNTRLRIARRPGTRPVQPLLVARLVALAKASAVVGAALIGVWGGAFCYTFLARERLAAAGRDAVVSGFGVAAAVLLVAAAVWLEQSCRTPRSPDDEETGLRA